MFTPVSSQAQAFVPAHAAYPHLRNQAAGRGRAGYPGDGVVLYGAHGQPLPPQQQPQSSTTLPPPHGLYYGRPMDERGPPPPLTHHLNTDQVGMRASHCQLSRTKLTLMSVSANSPPEAVAVLDRDLSIRSPPTWLPCRLQSPRRPTLLVTTPHRAQIGALHRMTEIRRNHIHQSRQRRRRCQRPALPDPG